MKAPFTPHAVLLFAMAALATAGAMGGGCSSVETVDYGKKDCVAGGCPHEPFTQVQPPGSGGASASSSSSHSSSSAATGTGGGTSSSSTGGGQCVVDANCTVSFAADVYTKILLGGGHNCAETSSCHGSSEAPGGEILVIDPQKVAVAYDAVTKGTLIAGAPLVTACDPSKSGLLCNLVVDPASGTNPYPKCGNIPMPFASPPSGTKLTVDEVNTIAQWISCGAPNN